MRNVSPIIIKELRPLLRSRKAFWLMLLALLILGGGFCFFWIAARIDNLTFSNAAHWGRLLFILLSAGVLCVLGLISPLITATSITAEREAGTLDLLLSTGLSRPRILLGKLAAALAYQLLLVFCMTPILVLPFLLGGIGMDEIIYSIVMILVTTVTYGMLGLAVSCWARRSVTALFLALFLIFTLAILIPFVPALLLEFQLIDGGNEECLFTISPILALIKTFNHMGLNAGIQNLAILLRDQCSYQGVLLLGFWILAWRGFARRAAERPTTARRQIDDPAELERRRRRWPYYLIDPLRRPQAIADGQNPLYIKEKRSGVFSRPVFFIRLCYLGGLVSVMFTIALLAESDTIPFSMLALGLLVPLAPLALTQSAVALAREREEKTLELLRTTPLPARAIVRAKFLALMRTIVLLTLSLILLPLLFMALIWLFSLRQEHYWAGNSPAALILLLFKALLFALALTAFYAALGLWCSARARRGLAAIVGAFVLAGALAGLPFILDFLDQFAMVNANIRYLGGPATLAWWLDAYRDLPHVLVKGINDFMGPLISPVYLLGEIDSHVRHGAADEEWGWSRALIHAAEMGGLAWLMLRLAARRLASRRHDS